MPYKEGGPLVAVVLPQNRAWLWHQHAILRLSSLARVEVYCSDNVSGYPKFIKHWLQLERALFGEFPGVGFATVGRERHWHDLVSTEYDVIFNFSEEPITRSGTNILEPRYNGSLDSSSLFASLMSQECPQLAIFSSQLEDSLATSHISIPDKIVLSRGLAASFSRLTALVERTFRHLANGTREAVPVRLDQKSKALSGTIFRDFCISFFWDKTFKRFLRRFKVQEYWSVAVLRGVNVNIDDLAKDGIFARRDLTFIKDDGDQFFADPFLIEHEGKTWLFVERIARQTKKGTISCSLLGESGNFGFPTMVLERPYHLSYPFVFEHENSVFMIPETGENSTVELYISERFPDRWKLHSTLLSGVSIFDATLVRYNSKYWLFGASASEINLPQDELVIFYSDKIEGPWQPHSLNPVKSCCRSARPAGRVISLDGRLFRPAQDCERSYGSAIVWCEITTLTERSYGEVAIGRWSGKSMGGNGLHTYNQVANMVTIDIERTAWNWPI